VEPNFRKPDVFERDPKSGVSKINREKSEICVLLEALGQPKVYYGAKVNAYFKDPDFENKYTDEEIQQLGLPIPIEIETTRRKLIKAKMEAGEAFNRETLLRDTCPKTLEPPAAIKERLVNVGPLERMINRVNRSTIGK